MERLQRYAGFASLGITSAVTSFFRFKSARVDPQDWKCDSLGNRITCSFEGEAVCQLEKLGYEEKETCGRE
jgi:hypothetical protein